MTKSLLFLSNNEKNKRWRETRLWRVFFVLSLGWALLSATRLVYLSGTMTTNLNGNSIYRHHHHHHHHHHQHQHQHRQHDPSRDDDTCQSTKYKGILLIQQGDREGAAGTIFYLFVLNQLLYAERHNLYPWIHLSNVSRWVYDEQVHGDQNDNDNHAGTTASSRLLIITAPDFDPTLPGGLVGECPAAPPIRDRSQYHIQRITPRGNGVWASYFRPQHVPTCLFRTLPVVTLTPDQILHGLHLRCPWSVRAWRYGGTSPAVKKRHLSMHDWWEPQRRRASEIVSRYYHWQPDLQRAIDALTVPPSHPCLGLHIRHSDKANQRRRLNVSDFIPFLEVYWKWIPGGHIYLATDSDVVVEEVYNIVKTTTTVATGVYNPRSLIRVQPRVWRSSNTSAIFRLTTNHDETNRQVLIDIGALSKCTFLLHGLSAVSEAAIYHNPALHERSINLETQRHPPRIEDWEMILQEYLRRNEHTKG